MVVATYPFSYVGSIHQTRNCTYEEPKIDTRELYEQLAIAFCGLLGNGILLLLQCGRSKLSTASFTYLRIAALLQFGFFLIPYPLQLFATLQRGDSWMSANVLAFLVGVWHFAVSATCLCFAVRLQLIINFVRRSRRWRSSAWIAWRKMFFILPFGIILNVSLCFEYRVDYENCLIANTSTIVKIGTRHLSEAFGNHLVKLNAIRATPTFMFWLMILMTVSFVLSEKFVLPKLSSPFAARHKALFSNLRPLVLTLVLSQAFVHIPSTGWIIIGETINPHTMHILYSLAYCLPGPLMLILSPRMRGHAWLITSKVLEKKRSKEDVHNTNGMHLSSLVCYSKLEMENSEIDERSLSNHAVRAILKEDAYYRVRFAISTSVPPAIQEEEEENNRGEHYDSFV